MESIRFKEDESSGPVPGRVSIIMPAYNGQKYIAESISSVIAQTYQNWELIVVDDGSVDRTAEIVRSLQTSDRRIHYIYQSNGKQAKARNTGIRHSSGEFIAFLDQDDLWVEKKLEKQVEVLAETDIDVVFSDGFYFPGDNIFYEANRFSTIGGKFDGDSFFRLSFTINRIPILSAIVRRKSLLGVGLFDEDPQYLNCDDYDLWLRLANAGTTFFGMSDLLVRYRIHPDQASKNIIQTHKAEISILEKYRYNTKLDEGEKQLRLRTKYRDLVYALIDGNRTNEAVNYYKLLFARDDRKLKTLVRLFLLRFWPGRYKDWNSQLIRVSAGIDHRVIQPLKNMRRVAGLY
jgi:glycosyltransferase involved in cell wall biosynthesis